MTRRIIGCAFTVSNRLGGGFLEKVYQNSLAIELAAQGIDAQAEVALPVFYRGAEVGLYRADLIVEKRVVVEIKAVSELTAAHEAQLLNYLAASRIEVALALNFSSRGVDVKRSILTRQPS